MKLMKLIIPLVAVIAVAAASAVALASGGEQTDNDLAISSGVSVPRGAFSDQDRELLEASGATGAITKIGVRNNVAFYAIDAADGGRCYGFASEARGPVRLGSLGCSDSSQLEQPLVDMSTIAMDPATGIWSLRDVQGVAADGVSLVGFVNSRGQLYTTHVVHNTYRMAAGELPTGQPVELVALDSSGNRIFSIPLAAS